MCLVQGPLKLLTHPNWLELQVEMLKVWWKGLEGKVVVLQPQGSKVLLEGTGKGGKKMINKLVVLEPWPSTALMADIRRVEHFGKNSCLYCNHWPLNAWRGKEKVGTCLICPTKKVLGSKSFWRPVAESDDKSCWILVAESEEGLLNPTFFCSNTTVLAPGWRCNTGIEAG